MSLIIAAFLSGAAFGGAVTSPIQARDLVLSRMLDNDTTNIRLSVYPSRLDAGTSILTWHEVAITTPSAGYVVFVDDMAYANFEHPCRYVFVDGTTGSTRVVHHTTPPRNSMEWLEMETEAKKKLAAVKMKRPLRPDKRPPPRKSSRGGEFYAVLMNGGVDPSQNYPRYWNDLSFIYTTLVDTYGYKDGNIFVLCSDGTSSAPDQSDGTSSNLDLDGDTDDDITHECVLSEVQDVFDYLAATLTADDQLFIFTTDHGGSSGGWGAYLNLWNNETLTDSQFKTDMLDPLPECDIITTMEQCFSGGFENNIRTFRSLAFASACNEGQLSWAMPPNYEYDMFVYFWTCAVNQADENGNPVSSDFDGDGFVSMKEAFLYAEQEDFALSQSFWGYKRETPQYHCTPAHLGDELFLDKRDEVVVNATVVCDNYFAIFSGPESGDDVTLQGGGNYPSQISINYNTTDEYTYIAAWGDQGVAQGLLFDLTRDGVDFKSGDPNWEVYATSDPLPNGYPGGAPTQAQMKNHIDAANSGELWERVTVGGRNAGLFYTWWPQFGSISQEARWIWFNSWAQGNLAEPFAPGRDHGEFLIFRLSPMVEGRAVCDNRFALFTGPESGQGLTLRGGENYPIPETFAFSTDDEYLYITAWSDHGIQQGLLFDLEMNEIPIFSGESAWEVYATGHTLDRSLCYPGYMPATSAVSSHIGVANTNDDWVPVTVGGPNDGSFHWGKWGFIDTDARWIWYDSGTQPGSNAPFEPGHDHDEFLIFRCLLRPVEFTLTIEPDPLTHFSPGYFTAFNGIPNEKTWLVYSLYGPGNYPVASPIKVWIELNGPKLAAPTFVMSDDHGTAEWILFIPAVVIPNIWFQAVQDNKVSNIVKTSIVY